MREDGAGYEFNTKGWQHMIVTVTLPGFLNLSSRWL